MLFFISRIKIWILLPIVGTTELPKKKKSSLAT